MSKELTTPGRSARNGFFLGFGAAAVIVALAFIAFRYDGSAKANVPEAPPVSAAAAIAPDTPGSVPLAEHVAAVSEPQEPPSGAVATPMTATAHAQSSLLSGTIELDPSLTNSVSGTVTVFVIARDGNGKGHPILAKRLDVASFPAKFALGAEDSMMGQPPPPHVSLEARIDLDHDAMTREPDVPAAKIDSVAVGDHGVRLILKRG